MSSKARLIESGRAAPFVWSQGGGGHAQPAEPNQIYRSMAPAAPAPSTPAPDMADHQSRLAALERESFVKGYEQGERAGLEAGTKRADAVLRRLGETIDELAGLRRQILQGSEQQLVQLAIALAKRIVRREVATDDELLAALARVALERLGDTRPVTIRLHPEDFARTAAGRADWAGSHVTVTADSGVSRGGCLVESPFGFIDAGIETQLQELASALLDSANIPRHA